MRISRVQGPWSTVAARRLGATLIAFCLSSAPVTAQRIAGFEAITAQSARDSIKVIDSLNTWIKAHPQDANALQRRGLVAWALEQRTRRPNAPRMSLGPRTLQDLAKNSLLAAADLEPREGRRWLMLGYFYRSIPELAEAAHTFFEKTIAIARAGGDSTAGADAALVLAGYVNGPFGLEGRLPTPPTIVPLSRTEAPGNVGPGPKGAGPEGAVTGTFSPRLPLVPRFGNLGTQPPPVALLAVPDSPEAALAMSGNSAVSAWTMTGAETGCLTYAAGPRNLMLPLADMLARVIDSVRKRFDTIGVMERRDEINYLTAQEYTNLAHAFVPTDLRAFRMLASTDLVNNKWPELLALGLQRARAVPRDPWGWMLRGLAAHRMGDSRTARFAFDSGMSRFTPADRARLDRLDRVLSIADSVTYVRGDSALKQRMAELTWRLGDPLWSEDEEDPRTEFLARITHAELRWGDGRVGSGADSRTGSLFIRYGPPDEMRGTFWIYKNGLAFSRSMYGGNACGPREALALARVKDWQPARWDNAIRSRIDSMPVQVARFRAQADSVEVFLATRAPVDSIRAAKPANVAMQHRIWVYSWQSPDAIESELDPDATGLVRWRERLAPGMYYYRFESTAPGVLFAGRASASANFGADSVTGFSLSGFGISDLILATQTAGPAAPARWSDLEITPVLGAVRKGSEISLVWENYDLGRRGTDVQYTATITLQRELADGARIGARIVRGAPAAPTVRDAADTLSMSFERRLPFRDIVVDNIAITLTDTPAGSYRVTLTLKDDVSGRTTSRSSRLYIRD